jgi:hypothetical protein
MRSQPARRGLFHDLAQAAALRVIDKPAGGIGLFVDAKDQKAKSC